MQFAAGMESELARMLAIFLGAAGAAIAAWCALLCILYRVKFGQWPQL